MGDDKRLSLSWHKLDDLFQVINGFLMCVYGYVSVLLLIRSQFLGFKQLRQTVR